MYHYSFSHACFLSSHSPYANLGTETKILSVWSSHQAFSPFCFSIKCVMLCKCIVGLLCGFYMYLSFS